MAVKRGKKQARRKGESSFNGLAWLGAGLLIGGAVAIGVWIKAPHAVDGLLPHPNPAAKPKLASGATDVPDGNPPTASTSAASDVASPAASPGPKKPKYDFYTLLPEREVVIPDDELNAQVKAEAANLAAKQQAALAAAATATASPSSTTATAASPAAGIAQTSAASPANTASSKPMASKTVAAADTAVSSAKSADVAATVATSAATTTANVPVPASQLKSGQYLLQAGAFRNTKQADDLKARIAMLGLIGRVETVQTPAGEMHRVRLGPYTTASELEAAKQKLSGSGLPAVAIRVK
ncbi:MAG: SPOR domain-containing protein [Proteobacteria bacterium]|nr:SPOR domain-containing protein [Pseudomonadota bacterium]